MRIETLLAPLFGVIHLKTKGEAIITNVKKEKGSGGAELSDDGHDLRVDHSQTKFQLVWEGGRKKINLKAHDPSRPGSRGGARIERNFKVYSLEEGLEGLPIRPGTPVPIGDLPFEAWIEEE